MGLSATQPEMLARQAGALMQCSQTSFYAVSEASGSLWVQWKSVGIQQPGPIQLPGLVKWLRANNQPLLAQAFGSVVEDLSESERNWIYRNRVAGCLPLVSDGELTAFVAIHDELDSAVVTSLDRELREWARTAAHA